MGIRSVKEIFNGICVAFIYKMIDFLWIFRNQKTSGQCVEISNRFLGRVIESDRKAQRVVHWKTNLMQGSLRARISIFCKLF